MFNELNLFSHYLRKRPLRVSDVGRNSKMCRCSPHSITLPSSFSGLQPELQEREVIMTSSEQDEAPSLVIPPFPPAPHGTLAIPFSTFLHKGITIRRDKSAAGTLNNLQGVVDARNQPLVKILPAGNSCSARRSSSKRVALSESWEIGKMGNQWVEPALSSCFAYDQ